MQALIKIKEYDDALDAVHVDGNAQVPDKEKPFIKCEIKLNDVRITVEKGDITSYNVDAIVNSANDYLEHGGGVAKAIVDAGD